MTWLHVYSRLLAVATLLLIAAGGMVTSTGAGLSVPDWPSSYGYFMFAFPLSSMVGGIFYEHGHRLIASIVGVMTIGLVVCLWLYDPRKWMHWVGVAALATVILQGVMGGITVLYFLPTPVSISHAGIAQIFFCLTVCLALFTSPGWHRTHGEAKHNDLSPEADHIINTLATGLPILIYVQILIGATMRHTGAGLAIPDFPLVFGGLLPHTWDFSITIHFLHRLGGIVTALAIFAALSHLLTHHRTRRDLIRPTCFLALLVVMQIGLGGWTVMSQRAPLINTAHVVTGALVLATALVLGLRVNQHRFPIESPLRLSITASRETS